MKQFTTTELRRDCHKVYNEVQAGSVVTLKHRDRPDMIMIRSDLFEEIKKEKTA